MRKRLSSRHRGRLPPLSFPPFLTSRLCPSFSIPIYLSSLPALLTPLQLVPAELSSVLFDRKYRSFVTGVGTGRRNGWRIVERLREGKWVQPVPSRTPSPRPCGRSTRPGNRRWRGSAAWAPSAIQIPFRKKCVVPFDTGPSSFSPCLLRLSSMVPMIFELRLRHGQLQIRISLYFASPEVP